MKQVSLIDSRITPDILADICNRYQLGPELQAEAPENRRVVDPPQGKVGFYVEYLENGMGFPLSDFQVRVLNHYRVHVSQLKATAVRKMVCYELLSSSMGIDPSLKVFSYFYEIKMSDDYWVGFSIRHHRPQICWGLKKAKRNWKELFFFISSNPFPASMSFRYRVRGSDESPKLDARLLKTVEEFRTYGDIILADSNFKVVPRRIINNEAVTIMEFADEKYRQEGPLDAVEEEAQEEALG